jgi:ketosteroid isomerase-like protein
MPTRMAAAVALVLALCAFVGCTVWGEHKPNAWKDVTGGESMERVFWSEVKAQHWADLQAHLAPNFVLSIPAGTFDGSAAIEHWKQLQLHDYSIGELQSQLNGNTYTVTYVLNVQGKIDGRPISSTSFRAMSVWQRQVREQWLMIAHSATPLEAGAHAK